MKSYTDMSFNEKYQAGERYAVERSSWNNMFSDPVKTAKELFYDYAGVRSEASLGQVIGLIKELTLDKGQPLDDKKG